MPDAPPATGPAADAARAFRHAIEQDCAKRGWTYQRLVSRTSYGEHHILAIIEGRQRPTRKVAAALDVAFGTTARYYELWEAFDQARRQSKAGSVGVSIDQRAATIAPLDVGEREVMEVPTRRELFGYVGVGVAAGLVEALDASREAGSSSLAPGTIDKLHHAIDHYTTAFPSTPADKLYEEVLPVRRWVGSLMNGKLTLGEHRELIIAAGWMSALLGLLAYDRRDYAALRAWCDDGRDRGIEAEHLELAAWSREPLAIAAFYSGHPDRALALAREGLALAPKRSAVEYKLAAQEMRALAALGDRHGFAEARRRAEASHAKLTVISQVSGKVFAASSSTGHPDMLDHSLVALGDWAAAERLYQQELTSEADHDTPGRSIGHLNRGIALAYLGRLDEASADGIRALQSRRLVGSVLVQASKLNQALVKADPGLPEVREFHDRYAESKRTLSVA
jgi:tetratricopeptide (TPR) repeat protein